MATSPRGGALAAAAKQLSAGELTTTRESFSGSKFTATILGASSDSVAGKSKDALYQIQVIEDTTTWSVYRTLKQFRDLNAKLKRKYSNSVVPSRFPSKSRLRSLVASPFLLDQQHMALQTWLAKVMKVPVLANSPEIYQFFEEDKRDVQVQAISYEGEKVKVDLDQMGYLYYMSSGRWKKRWFVLRNHVLFKYKSPTDKNPYRSYNWNGAKALATLKADVHSFVVTDSAKRRFYFAAESEVELNQWIQAVSGDAEDEGGHTFGVALDKIAAIDENGLPLLMTSIIRYIELTGLDTEDLFARPPDPVVKKKIEAGELDFELIQNVHSVAGLLQIFLKELPEPLLTTELYCCFIGVADISQEPHQHIVLQALIDCLPPLHLLALCRLLRFLYLATRGFKNRLHRLARIFAPLLLRRKSATNTSREALEIETAAAAKVITIMIQDYWQLFAKVGEPKPAKVWNFQEESQASPRNEASQSAPHYRERAQSLPFVKSISYSEINELEDEIRVLEEKKKSLEERRKERTVKTDQAAQAKVKTRSFTASRIGGIDSEMQMLEKKLEDRRRKLAEMHPESKLLIQYHQQQAAREKEQHVRFDQGQDNASGGATKEVPKSRAQIVADAISSQQPRHEPLVVEEGMQELELTKSLKEKRKGKEKEEEMEEPAPEVTVPQPETKPSPLELPPADSPKEDKFRKILAASPRREEGVPTTEVPGSQKTLETVALAQEESDEDEEPEIVILGGSDDSSDEDVDSDEDDSSLGSELPSLESASGTEDVKQSPLIAKRVEEVSPVETSPELQAESVPEAQPKTTEAQEEEVKVPEVQKQPETTTPMEVEPAKEEFSSEPEAAAPMAVEEEKVEEKPEVAPTETEILAPSPNPEPAPTPIVSEAAPSPVVSEAPEPVSAPAQETVSESAPVEPPTPSPSLPAPESATPTVKSKEKERLTRTTSSKKKKRPAPAVPSLASGTKATTSTSVLEDLVTSPRGAGQGPLRHPTLNRLTVGEHGRKKRPPSCFRTIHVEYTMTTEHSPVKHYESGTLAGPQEAGSQGSGSAPPPKLPPGVPKPFTPQQMLMVDLQAALRSKRGAGKK